MSINSGPVGDGLVNAFYEHLRRVRGVKEVTCQSYLRYVRQFLASLGDERVVEPPRIDPPQVVHFVRASTLRYRRHTVKLACTALRAFLRFLQLEHGIEPGLETAVPTVPRWRLAALPRSLDDDAFRRLITSLDASSPRARRDRAIVLCLARLGLRAGKVAALRLDDIDWHDGVVHVRTRKTRRGAALPLPSKVGRAIVDYLRRGRPATETRALFVLHQGRSVGAPIRSHVVCQAVDRAFRRAGIAGPCRGAHTLRYTAATRMVRHGASLKEIADVLGHRSLDTTAIYAKVDLRALRDVALPWPEVRP